MDAVKRCTAVLSADGSRCGSAGIERAFRSCLYPEGPEIRLCRVHARRWHQQVIDILIEDQSGNGGTAVELRRWERMADEWRYAA